MGAVSGTIRKIALDGVTYPIKADADVTINWSPYEVERIPTSGRSMKKMTVRNPSIESIPLTVSPEEADTIRALSERLDSYPLSLELADGSVLRGTGDVNFENFTTAENIATIHLHPDRAIGAWELFAAST
jgi:hypothetical protein